MLVGSSHSQFDTITQSNISSSMELSSSFTVLDGTFGLVEYEYAATAAATDMFAIAAMPLYVFFRIQTLKLNAADDNTINNISELELGLGLGLGLRSR